jgi:hypothetical protein
MLVFVQWFLESCKQILLKWFKALLYLLSESYDQDCQLSFNPAYVRAVKFMFVQALKIDIIKWNEASLNIYHSG